jgi:DNA-directed RNA polymerase subunit RPC12/RpoP
MGISKDRSPIFVYKCTYCGLRVMGKENPEGEIAPVQHAVNAIYVSKTRDCICNHCLGEPLGRVVKARRVC